jgi:hypothetical protein
MVGPHRLAKETSLGAASSAGRHPWPGKPPSGQPPPRHPGPGRPRMPLPLGRFPWPRGRAQPGPKGCFRGSTIYCPEIRLELVTGVCEINAHPFKGHCQTRPPRIPNFNVAGFLGGLRRCEINAHFVRDEVLEQTANIEIAGCGGSSPL